MSTQNSSAKHRFQKMVLTLALVGSTLLSGCAAHQGSGLKQEINFFKPLDDIQGWRGIFKPVSDGESGYFSEDPKDYIDEDGIGTGIPTNLRRGWVISPWAPNKGVVDVRHYSEGDIVECPFTKKPLRVPEDWGYKAVHIHP